jgi:hypothetical protein
MKANNKSGAKPIRYGDRTFKGWKDYYDLWGVRKPCVRTICSHYAKCKAEGMNDEEIIAAQKKLWREGITLKDEQRKQLEKERLEREMLDYERRAI